MKVETLEAGTVQEIGHAFGYYDYGSERGLLHAFPSRDVAAAFICTYVQLVQQSGMLYTTSENGEGYLAYRRPGERFPLKAELQLAKALHSAMKPKDFNRLVQLFTKSGGGVSKQLAQKKKPYLLIGLVCVRERYQGQGYMRKVMELAFLEGNRLGVPVLLTTDAGSKRDKYLHLGMKLAGTRDCGPYGVLYDLIKYPDVTEPIKVR